MGIRTQQHRHRHFSRASGRQRAAAFVGITLLSLATATGSSRATPSDDSAVPELGGETIGTFTTFDANQGIAVDETAFYAVNNFSVTKHDKVTGEALLQWAGPETGPVIHLDSGVVHEGVLYAAHSNYSGWPMSSSVEMFDTATMEHTGSHSFGIYRGSFTWLDRYEDAWWGAFANYNRVQDGDSQAYGLTYNTQIVKMDDAFQVTESWTLPTELLDSFDPMSNSGGSWGPDGRLYISGHDASAVYVMELPDAGSVLDWVATVTLADADGPFIEGQGIAWDRSSTEPVLWGILRETREAVAMSIPTQTGRPQPDVVGTVNGPGEFAEDL